MSPLLPNDGDTLMFDAVSGLWIAAVPPGGYPFTFLIANTSGPVSYAAGGFVLDLSATFTDVKYFDAVVETPAGLMPYRFEIARNTPSAGKVTIKVMRVRYDKVSSVDSITGAPGGVTVQAASGATVASESTHTHGVGTFANTAEAVHTHDVTHDHPSFSSAGAPAGVADLLGLGTPASAGHVHTVDVPTITVTSATGSSHNHTLSGTSAAGASHNHVDNNIYQHQHTNTQAQTDSASIEVANGTNRRYIAVGV